MNELNKVLNDEKIDLRLSFSRISDFDRNGPIALIRPSNQTSDGLKHGSLTDLLLTDTILNKNEVDEKYFIFDGEKPTATLGKVVDIVLDNYTSVPTTDEFLKIIKKNKFWSRVGDDKLIEYIEEPSFIEYLTLMMDNRTKIIVPTLDYQKAKNAVEIFLTHPFTEHYFNNNLENHYQVSFSIKIKNFTFKGFIDKITIDRENKKVYFEDIKTGSGKNDDFMKSFLKYRYYLQETVYTHAFNYICKKFKLKDYELQPFRFIFLSTSEKHPLIFTTTEKWHNAAIKGFYIKDYKYKGIYEILDDIYFHWKTQMFDYSKEIYDANGCLTLNDRFIDINE